MTARDVGWSLTSPFVLYTNGSDVEGTMTNSESGDGNPTRVVLGILVGAAVGGVGYVGLGLATAHLSALFAIGVGLTCGLGARLGAGPRSPLSSLMGGLVAAVTTVGLNLVLAGSFPAAVAPSFLLKTAAVAAVIAVVIGYGSRLTEAILSGLGDLGGRRRRREAVSSHARGVVECPTCGSMQTEPQDMERGGELGGLSCNACDHRWVP